MLDWPYAHLLINHFAIILTYVGLAATLLAVVRGRRGLWLYAVATLTLAGVAAYPVAFSGEEAAPAMKRLWFVDEAAIEDHEQAGERAQWILMAMGALAAYSWWRLTRPRAQTADPADALASALPLALRGAMVVAALIGAAAVAYAAYEGGFIVHKADGLGPNAVAPPGAVEPVPRKTGR